MVYDFGGGTLDVTIMKFHKKEAEVIYVDGNDHLGG